MAKSRFDLFVFLSLVLLSGVIALAERQQVLSHHEVYSTRISSREAVWESYTARGEEFSAQMPELPSVWSATNYLERLDIKRKERTYAAYADGVVYVIESYDNPKHRQSLKNIINEYVNQRWFNKESLVFKRDVTLGKFVGKQYIIKSTDQYYGGAIHFYVTDKHAYILRAIGEDENNPAINKFLDSFTLTDKPAGNEIGTGGRTGNEPVIDVLGPTSEPPLKPKEVSRKVMIVTRPEPQYTDAAREKQVMGVVVLRGVFSSSGRMTDIKVVSGLPHGLNEKAIAAARKIYFIPAVKDGKRVSQYIQIEYTFNLY